MSSNYYYIVTYYSVGNLCCSRKTMVNHALLLHDLHVRNVYYLEGPCDIFFVAHVSSIACVSCGYRVKDCKRGQEIREGRRKEQQK